MRKPAFVLMIGVSTFLAAALAAGRAEAQPPPSFTADCGSLRAKIATLQPQDGESLTTIEVEGVAKQVHWDGALAYFLLCGPPDPQVLCITYGTGDRKVGDRVMVAGNFNQRDADHVLLDPCLPTPREE